ncbi:MAG TPA: hypothetical protein VE078_12370 [Thermoanaerobaculia bacterium]|nr:hypothetical protein [Thermoanaerobaculia bacterium]
MEPVARLVAAAQPRPFEEPGAARTRSGHRPHHGLGGLQPPARFLDGGNWQTIFAWGRNAKDPGETTDSLLLESAAPHGRHTLFGRAERQENDELSGHDGPVFTVGKLSLGYIFDVLSTKDWKGGVGLLGSLARIPRELEEAYGGGSPVSWMAFLRLRV